MLDGGVEVSWCPTRNIEDGGYIELPTGVDYEPLLLDFSSFGDVTGLDYEGNLWAPPTALGLANTVWNCGALRKFCALTLASVPCASSVRAAEISR